MGPKGKPRSKKDGVNIVLGIDTQECFKGRTIMPGNIGNETEPPIEIHNKS